MENCTGQLLKIGSENIGSSDGFAVAYTQFSGIFHDVPIKRRNHAVICLCLIGDLFPDRLKRLFDPFDFFLDSYSIDRDCGASGLQNRGISGGSTGYGK